MLSESSGKDAISIYLYARILSLQPKKDQPEQDESGSQERDFELEDILDYIKTGIASVIEDEVTQRFVAEELKVSD